MEDELRRLEDEAESKRRAVTEHRQRAVAAGSQGGVWTGSAETPIDAHWLAQYYELRAAAEVAEHSVVDHSKMRFDLG